MAFKGHIPWNKGKKITEFCLTCGKLFCPTDNKWRQKRKTCSEECKCKAIREKNKGCTPWNKGRKFPQFSGSNCHFWKGGITPINKAIRNSLEYEEWRKSVFERDNYTCQICGKVGDYLNADHIKPFAHYPDLRFDLNNGRTLCFECHKKTDTYAGKGLKRFKREGVDLWNLMEY